MKLLTTIGLTKLIDLIKSSFIKVEDTIETEETSLKTINGQSILGDGDIVTTSSFADLTGQPTDNTNLAEALASKQPAGSYVTTNTAQDITGIKTFKANVNIGEVSAPKNLTMVGDLTIQGDITQNGQSYETHAEKVFTKDDYITLRDGATGGLVTGDYAGLQFKKYDGTNDGRLVIANDGTARVGDVDDEQPLLTRDEEANMTDGALIEWDGTNFKAKTTTNYYNKGSIDTKLNSYISFTNNTVSVAGTSKTVSKTNPNCLYVENGLVMGGSAVSAGLVTRGICGSTAPSATGACTKENLYLNYDGNDTNNPNGRGVVINAGTVGANLGNGMYAYCATRGDVVKAWVEAKGYQNQATYDSTNERLVL